MSVSDFRANMRRALARVQSGEVLEITKDGEVTAVVIHPSLIDRRVRTPRVLAAESVRAALATARERPLDTRTRGLTNARAEELVRAIRDERDRRG